MTSQEGFESMVLRDLYEGRFAAYFGALANTDALWLFVHVPKTAGSSFNAELTPLLKPNHHVFIDYTQTAEKPYHTLYDEAVERFIAQAQDTPLRYATGHINGGHVERIMAALPRVRPVTLMRQPVSRFISDYRYQRTPMHPGHEKFRQDFPTIEDYLGQKGEWNKTANYLVPPHIRRDGAEACIDYVMARYAFVGIQEMYPLSLRMVTTLAGSPARPGAKHRVNAPTPENSVELTPELERSIRSHNALDMALYEVFAKNLAAVRGELIAYLDETAPLPKEPRQP
jgi:hypothetical protein